MAYLRVGGAGDDALLYSIIANRAYDSHNQQFSESLVRRPDGDTASVYRGIVGNYPNMFLDVSFADAPAMINALKALRSDADWAAFVSKYEVHRSSAKFWPFLLWVNHWQEKNDQIDAGILDLSAYGVTAIGAAPVPASAETDLAPVLSQAGGDGAGDAPAE